MLDSHLISVLLRCWLEALYKSTEKSHEVKKAYQAIHTALKCLENKEEKYTMNRDDILVMGMEKATISQLTGLNEEDLEQL